MFDDYCWQENNVLKTIKSVYDEFIKDIEPCLSTPISLDWTGESLDTFNLVKRQYEVSFSILYARESQEYENSFRNFNHIIYYFLCAFRPQAYSSALKKQGERAKKNSLSEESILHNKKTIRLKNRRCKVYAGIAVWAKQGGITMQAAVEEINNLKLSLSSLEELLCPL